MEFAKVSSVDPSRPDGGTQQASLPTQDFNAKTSQFKPSAMLRVRLTAFEDRTFKYIILAPPNTWYLKRVTGAASGAGGPPDLARAAPPPCPLCRHRKRGHAAGAGRGRRRVHPCHLRDRKEQEAGPSRARGSSARAARAPAPAPPLRRSTTPCSSVSRWRASASPCWARPAAWASGSCPERGRARSP